MTNIIAAIVVSLVTNVCADTEAPDYSYWYNSTDNGYFVYGDDGVLIWENGDAESTESDTRAVEVWEVQSIQFTYQGGEYTLPFTSNVVSRTEERLEWVPVKE